MHFPSDCTSSYMYVYLYRRRNESSDGFVMRLFPQMRRRPDALRTNRPLLLQNMHDM